MDATSSTVENPSVSSPDKDNVGQDGRKQTTEQGPADRTAESNSTTGSFECNICLDTAKDAVVSMCGHLFCWPCLHCWLETAEARLVCPVCKAAISRDKVIPLYGRGGDHSQDPRNRIPPRPQGRRTEPEPGLGNFGSTLGGLFGGTDGGNFRMSVGIGAFPLSFLAATFNLGGGNSGSNGNGTSNQSPVDHPWNGDAEALSTIFLFVAIFFIAWLLIA